MQLKRTKNNLASKSSLTLLLAGLLLALLLAACGDSPTAAPPSNTGATTASGAAANNTAITINIDLIGFKFVPAEVTVPAGATVVWTNKEGAKHNVVADDGSFESPTLEKGASFSRKFDVATTISYYCKFHGGPGQGMTGKLSVAPAQAGAAATTGAAVAAATTQAAQATTAPATTAAVATTAASTTTQPATVAATTVAAISTAPKLVGTINFRDDVQLTDQIVVNIDNLGAAPNGRVYFGWLVNSVNGTNVTLGQLLPDGDGKVGRKFSDPKNLNLLATFDKFIITTETLDPTPAPRQPAWLLADSCPVRH